MSDNELIKTIHDDRELYKEWRRLSTDERREVLRLDGDLDERIEEVKTKQMRLFV